MTSGFPNMVFGWVVTSTLIPTNCRFVSLRYPTIKCTISFCCLLASYVLLSVTFFCVSPQPNTIIDKRKTPETSAMPTDSECFASLVVAAFAVCLQKKTSQSECKHSSGMSFLQAHGSLLRALSL